MSRRPPNSCNVSLSDGNTTPKKRPKDMTAEEKREHNRLLKSSSRARRTQKKIWWDRKKNAEAKKMKRRAMNKWAFNPTIMMYGSALPR